MTRSRLSLLAGLLICLGCSGTEETPVYGPGPAVWGGFDPDWTVLHPASGPERLLAACGREDGEAWAVGTGGVVVHHSGRGWLRERIGTTATLADVATDGRLVCAVGSAGTILVREGGTWRRETSGTERALRHVAFTADGTAWAGGEAGVLLRRAAAGWLRVTWSDSSDVAALAALGDTLVVGGSTGLVVGLAGTGERTLGRLDGVGPRRLAASPSGTLFALADSLYRYDAGRWIALQDGSDECLAANDSLVFVGRRGYRHDGGWPATYVPWTGSDLAAVCALGSAGALAVDPYGSLVWLRDGAWRWDLEGGSPWRCKQLSDGTVVTLIDGRLIAWEGDRWQAIPLPDGVTPTGLWDGFDRSRLLIRAGSGYLLTGARSPEEVPGRSDLYELRIAPDGGLVGVVRDGLVSWNGEEWRSDLSHDGDVPRFRLARTRAGDVFALNRLRVLRRQDGCWRELAGLTRYDGIYSSSGEMGAAGRYPERFVVLAVGMWLRWDARSDSAQGDWRTYGPDEQSVNVGSSVETADAVYLVGQTNRVLRIGLAGPGAGECEAVTGTMPDPITTLRIESDGAITAFASSTGRVWRHPGRSRF